MKVQSIIFDKKKFSLHLSKEWLKKHGYKDKSVEDTDHFFRFRQITPASLKKQGYIEFKTKKLGKGVELIIAYKECKCGGKISNDDLHHFLHSSYKSGAAYKDWNIDPSLSDASVQVYFNGKDAVVVHRGSQDLQDWKENALTTLGIKSKQPRLEHSRKIQKEAEQKYGADNVITIGHSKGSQHAEEVGQKSREIYTLNKPVFPQDLLKKIPKKQTDIKTTFDPVSILRPLQRGNKFNIIPSKSLNLIKEHGVDVLKRISKKKMWGKGIMKESCRKIGAGAGASAFSLEEKEDDIPPHPEPKEQIPSNMPAVIADLIDYLADLNKILNEKRRNLNKEDREFIEMVLEKIKKLFQNFDFPDFLEDKCRRIFKVLLKRNGLGNQLGEAIDEILQLIPNFEGAGAGASVVRNPEFDTLFQELLSVLRGNHSFNDISVKSVQLRITQLLIQITELSNLTRTNLTTTIELIDRIIERPLLEYRFKQQLETIKRILSSALHLQGGRPCYDNNAVVPYEGDIRNELDEDAFRNNPLNVEPREVWSFYKWNNEFRELKNRWDDIFKNYFEDIDIDEDLRMFFNSADALAKNLSGMNMKEEYLKYLRQIKNTHFIKNSHHYLRGIEGIIDNVKAFKGIKTGSGAGIVSNKWDRTEKELRDILENDVGPFHPIIGNTYNRIIQLFNDLLEISNKIKAKYPQPIPASAWREIIPLNRVILHLYNDFVKDNPRFLPTGDDVFSGLRRTIENLSSNDSVALTPREQPTISGRGREFALSYI